MTSILIVNDDGIHAEGLAVLEEIAYTLTDDVWVVAPAAEQSGVSHSLTLHQQIAIEQLGDKRFAVHGTPASCVMLALEALMGGSKPDLVLSGVNYGDNAGNNPNYSGTLAGAREAALYGLPAIALSQEVRSDQVRWDYVREYAAALIAAQLESGPMKPGAFLNINFPDPNLGPCKGTKETQQANHSHKAESVSGTPESDHVLAWVHLNFLKEIEGSDGKQYRIERKKTQAWVNPDTDSALLSDGYITVTHHSALAQQTYLPGPTTKPA